MCKNLRKMREEATHLFVQAHGMPAPQEYMYLACCGMSTGAGGLAVSEQKIAIKAFSVCKTNKFLICQCSVA